MSHDPFDRRSLLKAVALKTVAGATAAASLWAADPTFPQDQTETLKALGFVVLPASLGRIKTDAIAYRFIRWVGGYIPGAEMEHGYGFPKIESRPPSPGPRYIEQLRDLQKKNFATLPLAEQRALIIIALGATKALPRIPAGQSVIADLMSFYFYSPDAVDQCYGVAINSGDCRGFENVGMPPRKLPS